MPSLTSFLTIGNTRIGVHTTDNAGASRPTPRCRRAPHQGVYPGQDRPTSHRCRRQHTPRQTISSCAFRNLSGVNLRWMPSMRRNADRFKRPPNNPSFLHTLMKRSIIVSSLGRGGGWVLASCCISKPTYLHDEVHAWLPVIEPELVYMGSMIGKPCKGTFMTALINLGFPKRLVRSWF